MANDIEARLKSMGVVLPVPGAPAANYIPVVASGALHFVSGQIPIDAEGVKFVGKVGREYSIDEGRAAARLCAINLLVHLKAALGDLERIVRFVKVVGFVNAVPDFNFTELTSVALIELLTITSVRKFVASTVCPDFNFVSLTFVAFTEQLPLLGFMRTPRIGRSARRSINVLLRDRAVIPPTPITKIITNR